MKSYRLNISAIITAVAIFTLFFFCLIFFVFNLASNEKLFLMVRSYGHIIVPTSLLWILTNNYFWHTRLLQAMRKSANIPPDLRGRWEGELQNTETGDTQKFAIEIKQTLTMLRVYSYSSLGRSVSILPEIASAHDEEEFSLCYLWQGETHRPMKHVHHRAKFNGYTILNLHEHEKPRTLKGFYFTNHKPNQTRGVIELTWVSHELKKKLE